MMTSMGCVGVVELFGYDENENALYVAIAVQDADEPEANDFSVRFFTHDLAIVVIAIPRAGPDPLILGFLRGETRAETITSSGVGKATYEVNYATTNCFKAEVDLTPGQRTYEYRIDLTETSLGRFHVRPNDKLEVGLWVHDLDEVEGEPGHQQSTTLSWVNGNAFSRHAGRGEVLLVPSDAAAGRLRGLVKPAQGLVVCRTIT